MSDNKNKLKMFKLKSKAVMVKSLKRKLNLYFNNIKAQVSIVLHKSYNF